MIANIDLWWLGVLGRCGVNEWWGFNFINCIGEGRRYYSEVVVTDYTSLFGLTID